MILEKLLDLEKNPGARPYEEKGYALERFALFLDAIGNPQRAQHFVHVAGTKGKGSTVAMVEAMLRSLGHPTAMFTSPHMEHFGERYRFDGRPWTAAQFEAELERMAATIPPEAAATIIGEAPTRTVFEVLTALALVAFRRRGEELAFAAQNSSRRPPIVCWETGLGGRLDCTNVVDPLVTVITTIGLDHTALLGNTVGEIAREKAGIIKPGRPVIVARQDPAHQATVMEVITARAAELGAPLIRAWEHNPVLGARVDPAGQVLRLRTPDGPEVEQLLPLRGRFQWSNAEAAIAAVWYVEREMKSRPEPAALLAGLAAANWPGRLELATLSGGRQVLLDGAHCPLSARALGTALSDMLGRQPDSRFSLLFGMQKDKDHRQFLANLAAQAHPAVMEMVVCYSLPGPRGAQADDLVAAAQAGGFNALAANGPIEAWNLAHDAGTHIVAAGTIYTLAAFRRLSLDS